MIHFLFMHVAPAWLSYRQPSPCGLHNTAKLSKARWRTGKFLTFSFNASPEFLCLETIKWTHQLLPHPAPPL